MFQQKNENFLNLKNENFQKKMNILKKIEVFRNFQKPK